MRVGITGHQDLGFEETVNWVSSVVTDAVKEYHVTQGITSLAAGSDQLYAEILGRYNIPYIVVIPSKNYELTFEDKSCYKDYQRLISQAEKTIRLEFNGPSERSFFEAGKKIVCLSDIMFAIWDGKKSKGLGGTGDVVKYAILKGKKVIHFNLLARQVIVR